LPSLVRGGSVVGMNIGMRWNPALHELRRRLALGGGAKCALGDLVRAELRMHYRRWPREWQRQPWCAARAEGGPLREVGTHFFFGLMELFGHGCVRRVRCTVTYPDGPGGSAAESSAEGVMELRSGLLVGLSMRTDLAAATKDVYELEVEGTTGETLVLEDFARLRRTRPGGLLTYRATARAPAPALCLLCLLCWMEEHQQVAQLASGPLRMAEVRARRLQCASGW
jgi:predicted dehydrogenase